MHFIRWIPLFFVVLLLGPAHAGSINDPEIVDSPFDGRAPPGDCNTRDAAPHCVSGARDDLDLVRAWIQPKGKHLVFHMELRDLPQLENLPKQNFYAFHFTYSSARFYWGANWTADGSTFEYIGGTYQGCRPEICAPFTREGDRNYTYLLGASTLKDTIRGEYVPGSPGYIRWSVPLDQFGEDRRGLQFKGLFTATYQIPPNGWRRSVDVSPPGTDYVHQIYEPWWAKLVPGPSPLLLVAAAVGAVGVLRTVAHRRGG